MANASTKSYFEKLKDPRWQKKRLEVLDESLWACASCGDTANTLHVHHKQYIKGREPWEYESNELEVLCSTCHESTHASKARIEAVISQFPSLMLRRICSLLIGFGDEYVDPSMWEFIEDDFARAGQVAWFIGNYNPGEAFEFRNLCERLGPEKVLEALRKAD